MCWLSGFATPGCVNKYTQLPAATSPWNWDRWPILSLTPAVTGLRKMAWPGRLRGREYHDASWRIVSYGPPLLVFAPVTSASWTLQLLATAIDVGAIVVQRTTKVEGMTLSAIPYKAPKDARRAYEKGVEAERNGKLANARKYFEQAVEIYPGYASAWFQLGAVLLKENQNDAARTAYIQATTIDTKFLPPYLSLALMAYEAENWTEVLKLTSPILDLDLWSPAAVTGYILGLDPIGCADASFNDSVPHG